MAKYWSLFVQYPNREPVLRDLLVPQSLAELREVLEVFDDQHLLVNDLVTGLYVPVEQVGQLHDGASLQVAVPRRRVYVSRHDGGVRDKPVVWYPGAGADQIEAAIVKACGFPMGTPVELLEGNVAVVISATIPNEMSLTVVPLALGGGVSVQTNGTSRPDTFDRRSAESPRRPGPHRASSTPASTPAPRAGARSSGVAAGGGAGARDRRGVVPQPCGSAYPTAQRTPSSGSGLGAGRCAGVSPTRGVSQEAAPPSEPVADPQSVASAAGASARDEHCVHILAGHNAPVLSLCTVGDVLFTGSQDCSIMIWDLNNLQYIGTLPGHSGVVKCMVATLARKMLCSGSQDKTIKIWSLETFSSTKTLTGHTGEVDTLMILDGSDVLLSGGEDRSIRVWDLASLTLLTNLEQAHLSGVFVLKSLDAGSILSAGRDRKIKVWSTSSWQARCTLNPPHFDSVSDIAVASRSGRFYSASRDRSIRKWDSMSLESDLQISNAHSDWATSLALSPSERVMFSASRDSVVKVWDSNLCSRDALSGHRGGVSALLAIDSHLFSASHDRTVRVWRVDQFEQQE
mmetsp:Transcript_19508/g.56750  ORF Transcript_19508/g.56750 Transcript_19508/m.56750 type:complete len:571 (-) Transcript_19508:141-1853(-)|eukprot:CAMPEP_0176057536 /NCGR_PEP_ID=MMETSP0120_2-20121206/28659_1 /TAXON_ID=160619 /ORGANISM="Kryptoperidinium foliaceum, Strain CCMP 1326" /LENGTH=570 /DNA_ID=CAMNT_0017391051 /DNA_START=42 /DNA_END=1754 /DNA_ORIENTATION=+